LRPSDAPPPLAGHVRTLSERLNLPETASWTTAGDAFWFRPVALRALFAAVQDGDAEPELDQVGGTFAHALPVVIPAVVKAAGFAVRTAEGDTVP
jgi:hypothetical protein